LGVRFPSLTPLISPHKNSNLGGDPGPEIGCSRLSHFNLYSFIFGKKYGKVDYKGQDPPEGRNRRLAVTQLCRAGSREYNPVMKPYAQEAENLKLLLGAGIVTIGDVVAWADRTILAIPEYDDDLAEISLGANVQIGEMHTMLSRVVHDADFLSKFGYFGVANGQGASTLEAVRNLAGWMHRVLLTDRSRAGAFILELVTIWANWLDWNENVPDVPEWPKDLAFIGKLSAHSGSRSPSKRAFNVLMAGTAPFDTATLMPTPRFPASSPKPQGSSAERGRSVRERLRRLFRRWRT
jgi:hypothetical protein